MRSLLHCCLLLGFGLGLLVAGGGCSCNEDPLVPPCPEGFTVGELCPQVGMECPWPESRCQKTRCTCVSQPGGFYWTCHSSWCTCTCPCGYTARTSCETLECNAGPFDPCPAAAADVCAVVCMPPDGGADQGPRDARPDAPPRDARPDRAAEAGDGGREAAADQALDQARERTRNDRSSAQRE